jgi:hypothetical protein
LKYAEVSERLPAAPMPMFTVCPTVVGAIESVPLLAIEALVVLIQKTSLFREILPEVLEIDD